MSAPVEHPAPPLDAEVRAWARWGESRARRLGHGARVLGSLGGATLARSSLPRPRGPDPGTRPDPTRVVVLGTGFLGDLVLATPLLAVLRDAFAGAEITLLVPEGVRELLAESPVHDRLAWLPAGGRGELLAAAARVRDEAPDVAVVLPHTVDAALFAYATGAPVRVGHGSQGRGFLLTRTAANDKRVHEVERLLGLAGRLGVDTGEAPPPRVWPSRSKRASAGALLSALAQDGGPRVAVALGATNPARRWPPGRWSELLGDLMEARQASVLLLGGPADRAFAAEVTRQLPPERVSGPSSSTARLLDLVGRSSLAEVAWLLDSVDLMVGHDTGLLHLAASRGARVVGLYGPGDPVAWGPYGEGHAVVRVPMACSPCANHTCSSVACMRDLGVRPVLEQVLRLLGRGPARSQPTHSQPTHSQPRASRA